MAETFAGLTTAPPDPGLEFLRQNAPLNSQEALRMSREQGGQVGFGDLMGYYSSPSVGRPSETQAADLAGALRGISRQGQVFQAPASPYAPPGPAFDPAQYSRMNPDVVNGLRAGTIDYKAFPRSYPEQLAGTYQPPPAAGTPPPPAGAPPATPPPPTSGYRPPGSAADPQYTTSNRRT